MVETLELTAGAARARIRPGEGGALAGLWVGGRPVLRPCAGPPADGPFALACNVLAPFSNRISGGFDWEGEHHALPPNLPPEPFAIHGDAFQRRWQVAAREASGVALTLADGAFGPWRYEGRLRYVLTPYALEASLTLTNRAGRTLPYGLGFHPWFPRSPETRIAFRATGVWHEDARHLPAGTHPQPLADEWRFDTPRPLPAGWINNAFEGWESVLTVVQGGGAVPVTLRAVAPMSTLILFSPGREADFFCAEPVSHPVDAHNLPGRPGLIALAPGRSLTAAMQLEWDM